MKTIKATKRNNDAQKNNHKHEAPHHNQKLICNYSNDYYGDQVCFLAHDKH